MQRHLDDQDIDEAFIEAQLRDPDVGGDSESVEAGILQHGYKKRGDSYVSEGWVDGKRTEIFVHPLQSNVLEMLQRGTSKQIVREVHERGCGIAFKGAFLS